MFFEKNAEALLKANPDHAALLASLQGVAPITEYELLETQDGNYSLTYQGMPLHDPVAPLKEVRDTIQAHAVLLADRVHAVLGLGLGYLLDELAQVSPGQILVYEPDLPLLRFVLENVDLAHILQQSRIALYGDQLAFTTALRKKLYSQYKMDVLTLRGNAFLLRDEIPALMEVITRIELDRVQDYQTGRNFHLQWIQQFFQNSPAFIELQALDPLAGRFAGKPALVISRGPSLDAALPHIKALADSAVLIAVGAALHRLHDAGIVPDFALFYDANGMREQLHGLPESYLQQIAFVSSPFTQPYCYEAPARRHFLMLAQNNTQLVDWLDATLEHSHLRLAGGGTVSIIGYQLAMAMQCAPLVLVGQDLAFPNNQVYAGGIALKTNERGQMTLDKTEDLYAAPQTMDTVPGQNGETLPTLKCYKSFWYHLQDLAAQNASSERPVPLYNASIGGAHIEGIPLRPLSEFIGVWPAWKQGHPLDELPTYGPAQMQERQTQLLTGLSRLEAEMQDALCAWEQLDGQLANVPPKSPKFGQTVLDGNRAFYQFLQEHPFIAYVVMHEMIPYRERFSAALNQPDGPQVCFEALRLVLKECRALVSKKALPWVAKAHHDLQRRMGQTAPVVSNKS